VGVSVVSGAAAEAVAFGAAVVAVVVATGRYSLWRFKDDATRLSLLP
jgi:hypothetical protein